MTIKKCDRCGATCLEGDNMGRYRIRNYQFISEGEAIEKRMDLCISCKNLILAFMSKDIDIDRTNNTEGIK